MDVDAYVLEHREAWNRLDALTKRSRLTGDEADELVDLYQRAATNLAVIKGSTYDPQLEARLSALVTNARAVVTGASVPLFATIGRFFTVTFPVAAYRLRWAWIATGVISVVVACVIGYRIMTVPGLEQKVISPESLQALLDHDFAAYYSENPAADFAGAVWLNNTVVTATVILLGITVLPALYIWWQNMMNLGVIGGLMVGNGRADVFFGLLLPHGLLELTCIFIGVATGLSLAWSVISPGLRTRGRALAEAGRSAGAIAIGLGCALLVAGMLEAFITPSTLPAGARLAIGGVLWAAFLAYILVFGRLGTRSGETGDVEGAFATHTEPTEAAV